MNSHDAHAARTESERRQRQSGQAGLARWPWAIVALLAGAVVAIGLMVDLDLVWPLAIVTSGACAITIIERGKLRPAPRSYSWAALAAMLVLGLLAGAAVEVGVRAADLPLPNTWGATAAALTILGVSRRVQARTAASLRPRWLPAWASRATTTPSRSRGDRTR
ncbi:MAG: hypothetical protein QOI73_1354 [Solirubrobacteraceae bacterium]|nr:hypothetical protein [Solirubrobacteraceae bacterium]